MSRYRISHLCRNRKIEITTPIATVSSIRTLILWQQYECCIWTVVEISRCPQVCQMSHRYHWTCMKSDKNLQILLCTGPCIEEIAAIRRNTEQDYLWSSQYDCLTSSPGSDFLLLQCWAAQLNDSKRQAVAIGACEQIEILFLAERFRLNLRK